MSQSSNRKVLPRASAVHKTVSGMFVLLFWVMALDHPLAATPSNNRPNVERIVETNAQLAASKRELWGAIQTYLKELGLYSGKIDGLPGRKTKAAWAKFAKYHGFRTNTIESHAFQKLKSEAQKHRKASQASRVIVALEAKFKTARNLQDKGSTIEAEAMLRDIFNKAAELDLPQDHDLNLHLPAWLAFNLVTQGRYDDAEPLFLRALQASERVLGKDHPHTLNSVKNLATLYSDQGRYDDAEPLFRRALEASERVRGKDHPDTMIFVNSLAVLYDSQGRYDDAETLFLRALKVSERVQGKDHPSTLTSFNNLAAIYRDQGRYDDAETLFLKALEASERVRGKDHTGTLIFVNNLAWLYEAQGRHDDAEPLYIRALEAKKRLLGKDHRSTLTSVINLAELYYAQGRYEAAEPLAIEVLEARERVLGREHPDTLTAVNNLALLYDAQGRDEAAEPLYLRALRARERALGKEHPNTLTSVGNLALLYDAQGRYEEAKPLYIRAREARERVLGRDHPDTLTSLNNLALFYDAQGRTAEAISLLGQASDRQGLLLANTGQTELLAYEPLLPSLFASASQKAFSVSFAAQQWQNYSGLDASLAQLGARLEQTDIGAAKMLKDIQDLRAKFASYQDRLGKLYADGKTEQAAGVAKQLATLGEELDALTQSAKQKFPNLSDTALPSVVPLDKAQAILDASEALVMFGRGEDDWLYSWALTNSNVSFKRFEISQKELLRLIQASKPAEDGQASTDACLMQETAETRDGPKTRSVDLCASFDLYQALLAAHGDILSGKKNLFVVNGPEISEVPFHSLLTKDAHTGEEHAWLARDMEVTWLPNVNTLDIMRSTSLKRDANKKPFWGIAPGKFDEHLITLPDGSVRPVGPLPRSIGEIYRIGSELGADINDFPIEQDATEERVQKSDLRAYEVISFATHGLTAHEVAQLTNNKINQPSLLLKPGGRADGILTASEATQLLLEANWVLLSACNTAAGDGTEEAVGLSGLARSFFFAGARSLMVSHWNADDLAAETFMRAALKDWKGRGMSKAEAVHSARLSMLADPDFQHPYYWGLFSLVGDNL